MSALVLTPRGPLTQRIDLSGLVPNALATLSVGDIQRLPVATGAEPLEAGDVFYVSGEPSDTVVIEGATDRMDGAGRGMTSGRLVVEGDTGAQAAAGMRGGRLEIKGSAGGLMASGMKGGIAVVHGSTGAELGGARPGKRFGMEGGLVVVRGDVGARAGDRMRRGTVVIHGRCGPQAGSRMMGGTIWAVKGFGAGAGALLRRGTLIGPSVEHMLATFADCGLHDLNVLRLVERYVRGELGDLAPPPLPARVRRFAGDLATIGKGEILLTA